MQIRIPGRLRSHWQQLNRSWRESRWAAVAGRQDAFVIKLQSGVHMRLYGDSEICRLIYCRNFEATERVFLNHFLRPGDVFVDVGANIGLFTLIAAAVVGRKGRVVSFEPTATTFERLVDNVRLNRFSNVSCVNVALSDSTGYVSLNQSIDGYDGWNSLAPLTKGHASTDERVKVVEWATYAREHDLVGRVTMMKIDVEGWESRVLAGGREMFTRADAPMLQVEFTDEAAEAAGSSCQDLYKYLESLGYKMFCYDPVGHGLVEDPIRDRYPYVNLIAAKNPKFVNGRIQSSASSHLSIDTPPRS